MYKYKVRAVSPDKHFLTFLQGLMNYPKSPKQNIKSILLLKKKKLKYWIQSADTNV